MYDETSNISDDMSLLLSKPALCTVDFRPCQLIIDQMRKNFGDLKISATPTKSDISTTFQDNEENHLTTSAISRKTPQDDILDSPIVQLRFESPVECTSISPGPSGVWLTDDESKELLLVDVEGRTKQKIKHTGNIISIALSSSSGNVWFCCAYDSVIYEVPTVEKKPVKRFMTHHPPNAICITKEGRVVVRSGINITLYTTTGEVMTTTSVSKELQGNVIVITGSISQCQVTSNIAITYVWKSKEDTFCGVLHVYNKDLLLQFVYEGTECDRPYQAVYDSRGNLVVTTHNDTVQLVSGSGHYIRTLHMEETNVIECIGTWMDGVLWISILSEKKKMFARNTKSVIKTIKYYKT